MLKLKGRRYRHLIVKQGRNIRSLDNKLAVTYHRHYTACFVFLLRQTLPRPTLMLVCGLQLAP